MIRAAWESPPDSAFSGPALILQLSLSGSFLVGGVFGPGLMAALPN